MCICAILFHSNMDFSHLTTNHMRVPVMYGPFSFFLKCCLRMRIQCCKYIVFFNFVVVPSPVAGYIIDNCQLASFCIKLVYDKVL